MVKKIISTIFLLVFFMPSYTAETSGLKYEDIPKEHWAYNSINNLVKKGIIKEDSYLFRGENPVSRYEIAYYLSKTFDKLDTDKASQKDLAVIELLVSEFSKELTKVGFDVQTFNEKLNTMNESLEQLKKVVAENQAALADLKKRVDRLER
ncbi:MAG: S-layer homology domain-containing protein [Fusobacteriaceae bacterium]